MTKSTITRERLQEIAEDGFLKHGESKELARMALVAMDSEPYRNPVLAYADSYRDMAKQGVESVPIWSVITDLERNIAPLYRHAQPDISHLSRICAESYQVVGALAEALRVFNDVSVIKALDNLAAQELIHDDVLPFSVSEAAQPAPVVPDELLKEYLRLVDCMLSDYRNSNYGDAQRWIGHIVEASDAFEEKHGLSPWEMARKNCREAMLAATQKDSKS